MILLYNLALLIGMILGLPFIVLAVLLSRKRRSTCLPRLGVTPGSFGNRGIGRRTDADRGIWVHALSVGETRLAVPLVRELRHRFKGRSIHFTVSTRTGFEVAEAILNDLVDDLSFFPYDIPWSVKRAVDRIDPALVLLVESDIWPNFLLEMEQRGLPVILCNSRMSNRTFARYGRVPFIARYLFSHFTMICTQSEGDSRRFAQLGIQPDRLRVTGNLKFDQETVSVCPAELAESRQALGLPSTATVFVAGSTHPGEETVLLDAYIKLRTGNPDLRLILAPRDPTRAGSIERLARSKGLSPVLMGSSDRMVPADPGDVIIIDAIGILSRTYALADITFIGGSLVAEGGHNPLEPAAFSRPILFGPDMTDFGDIARMLLQSGGAIRVTDGDSLGQVVGALLADSGKAEAMGRNASRLLAENRGAVARTMAVVEDCFS